MHLGIQEYNTALNAAMVGTVTLEKLVRLGLREDVIVKQHLLCLVAMRTMGILLIEAGESLNLENVKMRGLIRMVFSMEAPNLTDWTRIQENLEVVGVGWYLLFYPLIGN